MILEHKFDLLRKSRDLQTTAKVHLANIRSTNFSDTGTIKDVLQALKIKTVSYSWKCSHSAIIQDSLLTQKVVEHKNGDFHVAACPTCT